MAQSDVARGQEAPQPEPKEEPEEEPKEEPKETDEKEKEDVSGEGEPSPSSPSTPVMGDRGEKTIWRYLEKGFQVEAGCVRG